MPVPRSTGLTMRRKSSRVSSSEPTRPTEDARADSSSRFWQISARPNRPMAMATNSSPSSSSLWPKVSRDAPVYMSCPTSPRMTPTTIIASALTTDPEAMATEATSPRSISEKYSAGPKLSATPDSSGPIVAMISVATEPAKNDPSAAVASALPACPCRAIL